MPVPLTNADSDMFRELSALGAGDFQHLNGTLEHHFLGVFAILSSWGASSTLCRAGLYHAAYGTAGFEAEMVSLDRREKIKQLIGAEAEDIVYDYCACDRELVWPQIGVAAEVVFYDRFTCEPRSLSHLALSYFCDLTCANEIDIANADPTFVRQHGVALGRVFSQWREYLSVPALSAASLVFGY